jgi:hypothetical protein
MRPSAANAGVVHAQRPAQWQYRQESARGANGTKERDGPDVVFQNHAIDDEACRRNEREVDYKVNRPKADFGCHAVNALIHDCDPLCSRIPIVATESACAAYHNANR